MLTTRNVAAVMGLSSFLAFAGCVTLHGSLSSSTDRLERNTEALARNADGDYSQDARAWADEGQDFRQTVEDRRADDRDIRRAFEEVSRDYHALRDEVDRSDSRMAEADFRAVTEAYLDIEREMGGHDSDRYAKDRERRDRF